MTSYFDDANREISNAPRDTEGFMQKLCEIERRAKDDVLSCAGDREFPEDLRAKIVRTIRAEQVQDSLGALDTENSSMALAMRHSSLLADLHSIFHELASRRHRTRFTVWWSDSPDANVKLRKAWEDEQSDPKP